MGSNSHVSRSYSGGHFPHRTGFDHGPALASAGGPSGVPKGKRRLTKARRTRRKKR